MVALHPRLPERYVETLPIIGRNSGSRVDTAILFKDRIVLGRVDEADVTGTVINIDHPLLLSYEARWALRSFVGETLIKIAYDGGELEVIAGGAPIGRIDLLQGPEAIIKRRNGSIEPARLATKLFRGDGISTGAGMTVRATFVDNTTANVGPSSEVEIAQIRKERTSVLDLIKGYIKIQVMEDEDLPVGVDKVKLRVRKIVICERGTDFTAEIIETNGPVSVRATVATGILDLIENRTGNEVTLLEDGESLGESDTHTYTFPSDDGNSAAAASSVALNRVFDSEISPRGDVDYYRFEVKQAGEVTLESFGDLDTIGYLYNATGELIAENDNPEDEDGEYNFCITQSLLPGVYFCAVKGADDETGAYDMTITHSPWTDSDEEAPTIKFDSRVQYSKARSFSLSAMVSDDRAPKSLSYRVKPPGGNFLPWRNVLLGGSGQPRQWTTPLGLTKEGRWEVQMQATDTSGNKSEVGTMVIIADRTKPTARIISPASVRSASYGLKANVADRTQLANVRYRLREPKATKFGAWTTVKLGGNKRSQVWSRPLTLRKTGAWHIELQSVDAAGNASKTADIKVNRSK